MKFKETPQLRVGILTAKEIRFHLHGSYIGAGKNYKDCEGIARIEGSKLELKVANNRFEERDFVRFEAEDESSFIELYEVVIGIGFHWERKEKQRFRGDLKILKEKDMCTAINVVSLEEYLESVIASEMSATASEALLKAHAVISRSWLLAQLLKQKQVTVGYQSTYETADELIRWYDREDHENFDVCADDHCQRYQGITRIGAKKAVEAVRATRGEVLQYGEEICDARFSKCCGGVVESFEQVWEPQPKPYLIPLYDDKNESLEAIDLTEEQQAHEFLTTYPSAFCNTKDAKVLAEVLNDYDQETQDFYRWTVQYEQRELSALIKERSGVDYGLVTDLIPVARSYSGRLKKLKIVGTKQSRTIGKELEIRKTLSRSHLYSAAFVVERDGTDFILRGAGWGHGVGLCQIGAAVMGAQGYKYKEILNHYFKHVAIEKIYD